MMRNRVLRNQNIAETDAKLSFLNTYDRKLSLFGHILQGSATSRHTGWLCRYRPNLEVLNSKHRDIGLCD